MHAALFRSVLRRKPMPRAAVSAVVDAFDRCDPTRSHEAKPSDRLRSERHTRRALRALFRALLAVAVLVALLSRFH